MGALHPPRRESKTYAQLRGLGVSRNSLGKICLEHQNFGAAVVEQKAEFGLSLTGSDGNDNGAELTACEHAGEKFPTIAEKEGDPIAARHAQTAKTGTDFLNQSVELAIGDDPIFHDCRPIGKAGDQTIEHFSQARWPLGKAEHLAAVIVHLGSEVAT